ncbi:MAG: EF-P lysine aminoacylase EpmA [Desulfocapsaceae bacterium]|jgi:lysyl-tRNA synthetase class 2|nr:EF-P lysine aminoacylase EpmA [Desulfocapsaceae bacterium]
MLDLEGLHLRAALFRSIRDFFVGQDFLEVDTPVRQPVMIPESYIEPIRAGSWFLQTSPEQCMKRLMGRGAKRIFQLSPCFRKGESGRKHLEEFMMLEWYRQDADYTQLMDDCRSLLCHVMADLLKQKRFAAIIKRSCLQEMELQQQWPRMSVEDAFLAFCPTTAGEALSKNLFDEMMVEHIEPQLGRILPLFLYDYPVQCSSLARRKESDPHVVERFEMYVNGLELANGFSELTDIEEQRSRFNQEIMRIKEMSGRDAQMPRRFLEDLQLIERAAGIALGFDRLLMLLMSKESINEVVSFSPADW